MNILALGVLSICLYAFGTTHQLLVYYRKLSAKPFVSLLVGLSAAFAQLTIAVQQIVDHGELNFSLLNSASITASLIVLCLVFLSLRKPIQTTFIIIYPIAALSVIGSLLFETNAPSYTPISSGIFIHIILSILAYSVFSIAAVQAILIYIQNNNLKKKNNTILMRNLPPLLTMENLLFEMLWSGTIILGSAIVAGFIFIEDILAQHLAHKTFFSLISFAVFFTLLAGRSKYGWRGVTASKFTLWGCTFLMIAFFGSKFVLEWIIKDM